VVTSDHKPVWGMFEVTIRPGKDSVPLAGGLFNRKISLSLQILVLETMHKKYFNDAENLMKK
jgi:hypothetical protein